MAKKQIFQGKVNGNPLVFGEEFSSVIFSMELKSNITDPIPLMEGTTVVVRYQKYRSSCYIRKGDQIELIGKIVQKELKKKPESIIVEADKLYNESLQFSLDY